MKESTRGLVAREFSQMPYGAGMNFTFVNTEATTDEAYMFIVLDNVRKVRLFLEQHAKAETEQSNELMKLQRQREAIREFLGLNDALERFQKS